MPPYEHPQIEMNFLDGEDILTASDGHLEDVPEDKNPGIDLPIDKN